MRPITVHDAQREAQADEGADRTAAFSGREGRHAWHSPSIAALVDDHVAAHRIESVLAAGGMHARTRPWRDVAALNADGAHFDVLLAACGAGVTQRGERVSRMRRVAPDAGIIALIPVDSRRGVRRALEAGADGVVFDADLEIALCPTVHAILAGQTAVPAARRHDVHRATLSLREKQVLAMVVAGKSNKCIAGELFLAESTVKCHLSSAFHKLGARSRNEAADLFLEFVGNHSSSASRLVNRTPMDKMSA